MRVMIFTCGTGGGHNSAAYALREEMLRRGHEVQLMNPYELKSAKLAGVIDKSYIKLVQTAPILFGAVYRIGKRYRKSLRKSPVSRFNSKIAPFLKEYLDAHHFDVILMTHFLPGGILANVKEQGGQVPPSILIATDYTCVPLTEETTADAYVIPTKELTDEFAVIGIPKDRIYPLGIPVSMVFSDKKGKAAARKELGLPDGKRCILIAGGSMGAGKIMDILNVLTQQYCSQNTQYIVISGRNPSLHEQLQEQYGNSMIILQHTSKIASYLSACDVFISKPGGLSSTEAAVSEIPLIHITPIPGCETANAEYFSRLGMSYYVQNFEEELVSVLSHLEGDDASANMRRAQRAGINKKSAFDICNLAESLVQ